MFFFVLKSTKGSNADDNSTGESLSEVEKQVSILEDKESLADITASVLKIECYDIFGEVYATGSGFVAFGSDFIVTNYHVIEDHPYAIKALAENGSSFTINTIYVYNEEMDIAILKTAESTGLAPLPFAKKAAEKTDKVVAIGSPLGLMNTVSDGIVSGFTQIGDESVIQFTASISSGSSGGVLLNEAGEVVGVTFASFAAGQNLNVAIPIQYVDALYNQASPANAVTVKQFFDLLDHLYPLPYILENQKDYMGKHVTIRAYISSRGYYGDPDGYINYSYVSLVLVGNQSDVLGFVEPQKDWASDASEMRVVLDAISTEMDKANKNVAIYVWLGQIVSNENLLPGSLITVSGKLGYSDSHLLTLLEPEIIS